MASVLVLNGPNLNVLGTREPEIYGRTTLQDIETMCVDEGMRLGLEVETFQSNHEGAMVECIQKAAQRVSGIVINAAAYSHTSIALYDALKFANVPVYEVHLSQIYRRESFRHHSMISPLAEAVICGLGVYGYLAAIQAIARQQA